MDSLVKVTGCQMSAERVLNHLRHIQSSDLRARLNGFCCNYDATKTGDYITFFCCIERVENFSEAKIYQRNAYILQTTKICIIAHFHLHF